VTRATPPWDRLKDLAAKRRDAEAQRLSAAVRTRDDAQKRLAMLVSYRADYHDRLSAASRGGIDLEALRNYQAFLAQLERAIRQQEDVLAAAERSVQGVREQWDAERVRVESFQALDERHVATRARAEDRHAQKLTDEWAARASTLTVRTDNNDH